MTGTGDTDTTTAEPTDQQSVAQTMDRERAHGGGDDSSDAENSDSKNSSGDSGSDDSELDDRDLSQVPLDELPEPEKPDVPAYGEDEEQGYVDRDAIDFDPADGLYSGTAVKGGDSELPDPPSEEHVKAAFEDIKAGGNGLVDEQGNKVENRQDADD